MNIWEEIRRVSLPPGEFMVLGSGILSALDIRGVHDIDLLITPTLFDQLKSDAVWKYEVVEIEGRRREKLSSGSFEAFKDFWWEGKSFDSDAGFAMAETINKIAFLPLKTLLEVKRGMKREKDARDVLLIEKYLHQSQL